MSGRVSLLLVSSLLILVVLSRLVRARRAAAVEGDRSSTPSRPDERAAAGVTSLLQGPESAEQSVAALRVSQIAAARHTKMSQILRQLSASALAAGVELDGITPGAGAARPEPRRCR